MSGKLQRLAPFGLVVAGAAALVALSLYIIQREWNIYLQVSLGLIVLGLATFAFLDPARVRRIITGRQARHGSNALVLSLAFLGSLIVINYLVYQNSQRWDLTEDKSNTLAPESIETLSALPETVTALAFFSPSLSPEAARNLLEKYKVNSKGKFEYRVIDPESDPIAAQKAKVTRDGMIVLQMGERMEPVTFISEKELTSALVRLISKQVRNVYFLTGHGEKQLDGSDQVGYSAVRTVLESKNYQVEPLNLLATNNIPDDADVIVIAGALQPLAQTELDELSAFVQQGGSLIVLAEPYQITNLPVEADLLAQYLASEWGVQLGDDIIVDLSSQQPFVAVASSYARHPITEKLLGLVTFFPSARSIRINTESQELSRVELVKTSEQAWGETSMSELESQRISPTADEDYIGNLTLAAALVKNEGQQRLVIFGDSDFVTNENFIRYGNGDLFINAVDWTAKQEELINLTPRERVQRFLVPPQRYTMGLIFFVSVFMLPATVLIAGVVVWYQRRKRG